MRKFTSILLAVMMLAAMLCLPAAAEEGDFLLLSCDSLAGFRGRSEGSYLSDIALSGEKTEGTGSVKITYPDVTADGTFGGQTYVDFLEPVDLSNYTGISLDLYVGEDMSGIGGGIQLNLASPADAEDGFNMMAGIDNSPVGWKTVYFTFADAQVIDRFEPNWASVRRMRIGYLNYQHMSDQYFLVDNICLTGQKNPDLAGPVVKLEEETPPAAQGELLLSDCDSLAGWMGDLNMTTDVSLDTASKTQGEASVKMEFQKATVNEVFGGCAYLEFAEPLDVTNYSSIKFDLNLSKASGGKSQGIQINLVSDLASGYGYNLMAGLDTVEPGWNSYEVPIQSSDVVAGTDLTSVKRIRIGYLNYRNQDAQSFTLDNFRLSGPKNAALEAPKVVLYEPAADPDGLGFAVDGQKDARYNDVYSITLDSCFDVSDGASPFDPFAPNDMTARMWYAWDAHYLYYYVQVHDEDIEPGSQDDYVEFWVDPDTSTQKNQLFCDNVNDLEQGDTNIRVFASDFTANDIREAHGRYWWPKNNFCAVKTEDGYAVEIRVPRVEGETGFQFNIAVSNGARQTPDGEQGVYRRALGPGWWADYSAAVRADFADNDFLNPPSVKGTVTAQQQGIEVNGILVTLHAAAGTTVTEEALQTATVADGAYQFDGVVPGSYVIRVAGTEQYDAVEVKVKVTGRDVTVPAIVLGEQPPAEPDYGDVNGDGDIDSLDALMVLQHIVGNKIEDEAALAAADAYLDGDIDSNDALCILQYSVGIVKQLPERP